MFRLTPIHLCSEQFINKFEYNIKTHNHFVYLDTKKAYVNYPTLLKNIDDTLIEFKTSKYVFIGGSHWGPGFYHCIINRLNDDTIEILKLISDFDDSSFEPMLSQILLSTYYYNCFTPINSIKKIRIPQNLILNNFEKNFILTKHEQYNIFEYIIPQK